MTPQTVQEGRTVTHDPKVLSPCPFCGNALAMRAGVNPYGRCITKDCWLADRRVTVPLDDLHQVHQWNARAALSNQESSPQVAENERLREALRRIEQTPRTSNRADLNAYEMQQIARDTLAVEQKQ